MPSSLWEYFFDKLPKAAATSELKKLRSGLAYCMLQVSAKEIKWISKNIAKPIWTSLCNRLECCSFKRRSSFGRVLQIFCAINTETCFGSFSCLFVIKEDFGLFCTFVQSLFPGWLSSYAFVNISDSFITLCTVWSILDKFQESISF